MSPHAANSLITDLVQMAQASELLPQVRHELEIANGRIATLEESIQSRELRIIDLKGELDAATASIRSLEVARDDAELRFLEADDKAQIVVRRLGAVLDSFMDTQAEVTTLIATLSPPKPEPVVPQAPTLQETSTAYTPPQAMGSTTESHGQPTGGNGNGDPSSGQSEAPPTSADATSMAATQSTDAMPQTVQGSSDVGMEAIPPTNHPSISGPYAGLRYYDHQSWVSRKDWLAGGGTGADYDWRPAPAFAERSF